MRRRAVAALLVCLGCGESAVVVPLPVWGPEIESWIVAHARDDGLEVRAADVDAPTVELDLPDVPSQLELRGYIRPLAELNLARGVVAPSTPGRFPRPLPEGRVQLVARVSGAEVAPWSEGALPSVAAFQFGLADPCSTFSAEIGRLDHGQRIAWAINLDPDTVLMGSAQADLFRERISRIHVTRGLEELRLVGNEAEKPQPRSAFKDARGRLWIGDRDGGLWRGAVEGDALQLERVVPATPHGEAGRLDGDPRDPETQLFTVTTSGTLARLENGRWGAVNSLPLTDTDDPKLGLVWLGTNDVLYGTSAFPLMRRWRALLDVEDFTINDDGAGLTGLVHLGGGRVVVGMGGGLIGLFDAGGYTALGRAGLALDIIAFSPLGDGFLYTGVFGYIGEWNPEVGYCPVDESPIAGSSIRFMLPFGDRLFLVGDFPRGAGNTSYSIVTVERP